MQGLCPFMLHVSFAAKMYFEVTLVTCMLDHVLMIARGTCGPSASACWGKYPDIIAGEHTASVSLNADLSPYIPLLRDCSCNPVDIKGEQDSEYRNWYIYVH
jgi:hypothetical protein